MAPASAKIFSFFLCGYLAPSRTATWVEDRRMKQNMAYGNICARIVTNTPGGWGSN